jgi:multidrug efflux system outer membrane protein
VAASVADLPWWQVYDDPVLQSLITEALQHNYDVRIAVQNVLESRELERIQEADLMPQITYSGAATRGRNQLLGNLAPQGGSYSDGALAQVGVSWEIDLWGRLRRADEAARAKYLATIEAQRGVWLSLVSDVATTYFQLLSLDAQLQVSKDATKTYTDTLKIFQDRLEGGVASLLDVSSAAGALGAAAAQIPELESEIRQTENQLSVLLGRNPGPIARGRPLNAQTVPPQIPAGLPSQLLERRPDIRQAEQNLVAANAQIGVAKADFFPRLSLTGALGKVSSSFTDFTAGGSNAWAVAANLAGPIFEGGRLTAQYKQTLAEWEAAKLQYQYTVLSAFQDVSNALISQEKLGDVRVQQEYSVKSYAQAVDVSMKRYIAGKASYYDVLDAQTKLFPNEANLVNTRLNQLLVMVQLYKALGGGWSVKDADYVHDEKPAPASP